MKNILKIAATLSLLSGAAVADPVLGVWKTTPDDNGNFGHIKVAECEGEICGTLIKSFDSTGASYESSTPYQGRSSPTTLRHTCSGPPGPSALPRVNHRQGILIVGIVAVYFY